nr:orsellinic acid/f9775 biosynthesis cluster protein [Quercus suber]
MSSSSVVFLPTILREFRWLALRAQAMTIPVYLTAFALTVLNAMASDRLRIRYPFCAGPLALVIIGYSIFLAAQHVGISVRFMACFFLISGNFAAQSTAVTWLSNNVVGKKRRGIALGIVATLGNCGFLLGSNVYLDNERPWYPTGFGVCLALSVIALTSATAQVVYLRHANRCQRQNSSGAFAVETSAGNKWIRDGSPFMLMTRMKHSKARVLIARRICPKRKPSGRITNDVDVRQSGHLSRRRQAGVCPVMVTNVVQCPPPQGRKRWLNFAHLRQHRVLLCVQCGYCVLPQALDRHLKCLHGLNRAQRAPYVDAASRLQLADADEVPYPEPNSPPIPGLPANKGLACCAKECQHLCQTSKRMQAHWRRDHSTIGRMKGPGALRCRKVTIQSFFRGSSLRYFIVDKNAIESKSSDSSRIIATNVATALSPPPGENSNQTAIDWLLTREFGESSFAVMLPTKGTRLTWRDEMMQASTVVDSLRFALLSVTASYIAYQNPQSRRFYGCEAAKYRHMAITSLSALPMRTTSETFFAHWNFQRLMTICCMSQIQLDDMDGQNKVSSTDSVLPEWVSIQRRGRSAVWQRGSPGQASKAMHVRSLAGVCLFDDFRYERNPFDPRMHDLEIALLALTDTQVDPSCFEALGMLRRSWLMAFTESETVSFRDMALMFTARAPEAFIKLMQDNNPIAMVIFAHFCVLWSHAEASHWYMRGQAAKMLFDINLRLSWEWQEWIQWPIEMVLGLPSTVVGRAIDMANSRTAVANS